MVRDAQDLCALVGGDKVGVGVETGIVFFRSRGDTGAARFFGSGNRFRGVGLRWSEGFGGEGPLDSGVGGELEG